MKLSTTTVSQIPLSALIPDPDQPRQAFDPKALSALADNIKQRGIQVPLLVRTRTVGNKTETVIKDGERRWRAAKLAKLKSVPCLLVKDSDVAQIRIDQVSVNNLREELRPMELARTLHKMQHVDKLSANEIASRLAKQGIPMSQAQATNLIKLVDLPAWAQAMVDDEQIEVTVAREIANIADKPVLAKLEKHLKEAASWRGRVTASETKHSMHRAFDDAAAADLTETESYRTNPVRFDYKKVCKGCPHLRESHGGAWCMDQKGFDQHQAEAKEAGLGPGGLKPERKQGAAAGDRPLTPAQQRKADAKKAELRTESLEKKSREYLHSWARKYLALRITPAHEASQMRVLIFAAACRPGIPSWENSNASHSVAIERKLRKIAADSGLPTLQHLLKAQDLASGLFSDLAREVATDLPLIETLQLMHHLHGTDLAQLWQVDSDYLDLLQKAELIQVAEKHCQLPEGKKSWAALKTDELTAAILAARAQVGVPPTLARLYSEAGPREVDDLDGDDADRLGDDEDDDGRDDEE